MKVLPCGAEAVLAQFDSLDEALAFDAALAAGPVPGVLECVPAARTVLVCFDPSVIGADFLAAQLRRVSTRPPAVRRAAAPAPVEIPVRYDGPDLDLVAAHLGWLREEVVARHTGSVWRVGFVGRLGRAAPRGTPAGGARGFGGPRRRILRDLSARQPRRVAAHRQHRCDRVGTVAL